MRLLRPLAYVWTFPTTLVGLLMVPPTLLTRGGVQLVDGVLEVYGGAAAWALRHLTLMKRGASAMALGHVVLGVDQEFLDLSRRHERIHVRQAERWGPLFIPAYLLASLWALVRGGSAYRDNAFEREAYGQ